MGIIDWLRATLMCMMEGGTGRTSCIAGWNRVARRGGERGRQGERWRMRGEGEENVLVQPAVLTLTTQDLLAPTKRSIRFRGNLQCEAVQGGEEAKKQTSKQKIGPKDRS